MTRWRIRWDNVGTIGMVALVSALAWVAIIAVFVAALRWLV